jgi:type IV secretory pathway TrbD component
MSPLRRVPFLRVLWRPHLWFGGERDLALFVTAIAVILPVWGLNWAALFIGVGLWIVAMPALRWAAKVDPQFSQVYRHHIRYRRFYPARSRPYRTL